MDLPGTSWSRRQGGARPEEPGAFTGHVRALAEGEPLSRPHLDAVWKALRAALRSELKKRGLWESPPSYLGVFGWTSWEGEGGGRAGGERQGALEELLIECYSFIFVDRLRSLEAQRKNKPNVDGLIFLNIRHFLHERQKEHDPLGAQVFEVLQAAVRLAVSAGELAIVFGDARIRNDTVLGFGREAVLGASVPEEIPAVVARWNDELLPDLVTLRGRRQEEVVQRLREHLGELSHWGVESFRFKDLVDPMKADVRSRWAALLEATQGAQSRQLLGTGPGEMVRVVPPDTRVEERQVFRKLIACVLDALERLDVPEKTRGYLATLWQFVRVQASEGVEASAGALDATLSEMGDAGDDDRPPSLRRIAEQLRIPRERLPGLYQTLGELLERCRTAISSKSGVISLNDQSL